MKTGIKGMIKKGGLCVTGIWNTKNFYFFIIIIITILIFFFFFFSKETRMEQIFYQLSILSLWLSTGLLKLLLF